MNRPPFADQFEAAWGEVADRLPERLRGTQATVVRWRYARAFGSAGRLEPFLAERRTLPTGEVFDTPEAVPADEPARAELGYDAVGRVRVVHDADVTLLDHSDAHTDLIRLAPGMPGQWDAEPPTLLALGRATMDGSRITAFHELRFIDGQLLWAAEHYVYDADGRLDRVRVATPEGGGAYCDEHLRYDADGRLESVVIMRPTGDQHTVWRRPPRDLTRTRGRIRTCLAAALVAWARAHWPPKGPLALGVVWSIANDLPPLPALLTSDEFMAIRADGREDPWMPTEYDWFGTDFERSLPSSLLEDLRLVDQQRRQEGGDDSAWRLVEDVTRLVAQHDWSALPEADGFFVYLVDLDEPEATTALMAQTVPSERLEALRRLGWLDTMG